MAVLPVQRQNQQELCGNIVMVFNTFQQVGNFKKKLKKLVESQLFTKRYTVGCQQNHHKNCLICLIKNYTLTHKHFESRRYHSTKKKQKRFSREGTKWIILSSIMISHLMLLMCIKEPLWWNFLQMTNMQFYKCFIRVQSWSKMPSLR